MCGEFESTDKGIAFDRRTDSMKAAQKFLTTHRK